MALKCRIAAIVTLYSGFLPLSTRRTLLRLAHSLMSLNEVSEQDLGSSSHPIHHPRLSLYPIRSLILIHCTPVHWHSFGLVSLHPTHCSPPSHHLVPTSRDGPVSRFLPRWSAGLVRFPRYIGTPLPVPVWVRHPPHSLKFLQRWRLLFAHAGSIVNRFLLHLKIAPFIHFAVLCVLQFIVLENSLVAFNVLCSSSTLI